MKLQHSAQTDVGRMREVNQDSFGVGDTLPNGSQLFVVCDGMGGHLAGEVASRTAVETLLNVFHPEADDISTALDTSFHEAHRAVYRQGSGNMGTTGVALVLYRNVAFIANVGDSRAYLIRKGEIRQLTVDHSFVEEQVRAGFMTREQARTSYIKNIITRAIGQQDDIQVDIFVERVQVGDIFLLCSDGLHGFVEEEDILAAVQNTPFEGTAQLLVDLANEAGGPDNITALLVHVEGLDDIAADDPILASLLAQTARPKTGRTGPTGTAPMAVMRDDATGPLSADAAAPAASASQSGAPPQRPQRERSLTLWGGLGALTVLLVIFGVLYFYNLPPVSFLFASATATPVATTTTVTQIPTTTPLATATAAFSATVVPLTTTPTLTSITPTP